MELLEKRPPGDEWSLAMIAQFKAQIANDPKEVAAQKEELANMIRMQRKGPPAPSAAK